MATTAPRKRSPRGEGGQLREQIVQAARVILESTGDDDAVSLRAVAREVGITAPSIYRHFADRGDLFAAIAGGAFAELTEYLAAAAAREQEPLARLRAVATAYVQFAADKPHLYRVLFERHRREFPVLEQDADPATRAGRVTQMVGADAFGQLLDAVRDCVNAGVSSAPEPLSPTVRLWTGLHGMVTLRASLPFFPWPPVEELLDDLLPRLADLNPTVGRSPWGGAPTRS